MLAPAAQKTIASRNAKIEIKVNRNEIYTDAERLTPAQKERQQKRMKRFTAETTEEAEMKMANGKEKKRRKL